MYDEYETQTTAVEGEIATTATAATAVAVATTTATAAAEGTTTTTTIPYLDTDIYNAVDVNSDAGKAQLADKDIDYDKIYNDFLYNVVVPNTEGGISSVTEGDKAQATALNPNVFFYCSVFSQQPFTISATTVFLNSSQLQIPLMQMTLTVNTIRQELLMTSGSITRLMIQSTEFLQLKAVLISP